MNIIAGMTVWTMCCSFRLQCCTDSCSHIISHPVALWNQWPAKVCSILFPLSCDGLFPLFWRPGRTTLACLFLGYFTTGTVVLSFFFPVRFCISTHGFGCHVFRALIVIISPCSASFLLLRCFAGIDRFNANRVACPTYAFTFGVAISVRLRVFVPLWTVGNQGGAGAVNRFRSLKLLRRVFGSFS